VATLVLGSPPPELEALIERRRCAGVDHLDEVWLEILSPGDESLQKLPFYAAHDVDEILIVDATDRTVTWLGLRGGEYHPLERSRLIELGPADLAGRLEWP